MTNTKFTLNKGKRMTKQRVEILNIFKMMPQPVQIQDIVKQVKANEVSVYRTVRMLQKEGFIKEINYPDRARRYEMGGHHHHIICNTCGFTEHLSCEEPKFLTPLITTHFKKVTDHVVTYYGICVQCES